jgi:hypothetical protein
MVSATQIGSLNLSENSKPKCSATSTLASYLVEQEILSTETTLSIWEGLAQTSETERCLKQ